MISSPYCADSGFVFIFVLNSLKRYTVGDSVHEVFKFAITDRFVQEFTIS